jgi:hypothetical protein
MHWRRRLELYEEGRRMAEGFTVKDSGERQQFDSGMQRDVTAGKPRYDLVFDGPLLARCAEHLRKGAEKYTARNWMKASGREEMLRFRESAARHFAQWMAGDTDEDHAAAVVFNLNGYEYVKEKIAESFNKPGKFIPVDGTPR